MEIRPAEPEDRESIRRVVRRSLRASYSLSPTGIDSAMEQWYGGDSYAEKLDRSGVHMVVATTEDTLAGYAEGVVAALDAGDLRWIHVAPAHRGRGIGSGLFERMRERLRDHGVDHLRGNVLAANEEGNTFYERHGFEKVDTDAVEIGGQSYVENVYIDEGTAAIPSTQTADDRRVYVDRHQVVPGTRASFRVVHTEPDRETRYGFFCSNCDVLANAIDPMGRIECTECGNVRKAQQWDAAYL